MILNLDMNKAIKQVTKADLLSLEEYSKNRKVLRKEIVNYKKVRRVPLGPYANFYFESYETMKAQIQEMLYIEKGGDEQLNDELSAYNPLIPKGKEFVATLMFEIDNPISRADFLGKIGGIEKKVFIQIQNEKINATAEQDTERTSEEGKASSVHFLHFIFTENQIKKIKDTNNKVELCIDHEFYSHKTTITPQTINALTKDLD